MNLSFRSLWLLLNSSLALRTVCRLQSKKSKRGNPSQGSRTSRWKTTTLLSFIIWRSCVSFFFLPYWFFVMKLFLDTVIGVREFREMQERKAVMKPSVEAKFWGSWRKTEESFPTRLLVIIDETAILRVRYLGVVWRFGKLSCLCWERNDQDVQLLWHDDVSLIT